MLLADTKLVAGVEEYFVPGNVTVVIGGVSTTPATMVAAIQSRIDALNGVALARAALQKAIALEESNRIATRATVNAVKQVAIIMYANAPDTLTVFGLAPRKVRAPRTLAEKAEAAAKAKATRIARNTMGPKQKAKIHGVVAPIATGPATNGGATHS